MDATAKKFNKDEFVSSKDASNAITFDEARTVIGRAFTGTESAPADPFNAWLLEPINFKDEEDKIFSALFILGFPIYDHQKQGGVYLGERDEDDKLMSCILLKEHDPNARSWFAGYTTSWNSIQCFFHLRSVHGVPDLFMKSELKTKQSQMMANIDNFEKQEAAWHKEHGPTTKHWHISMVGVDPQHQAKGLGKRMMERLHDLADTEGVTCYLGCVGAKNEAFYKKLGYNKATEGTLTDPSDETRTLVCSVMIREPKSVAS